MNTILDRYRDALLMDQHPLNWPLDHWYNIRDPEHRQEAELFQKRKLSGEALKMCEAAGLSMKLR